MITRLVPHPLLTDTRVVHGAEGEILGWIHESEGFQPTRDKIRVFSRQDLQCILRYMPDDAPMVQGGPAPIHSCPGEVEEYECHVCGHYAEEHTETGGCAGCDNAGHEEHLVDHAFVFPYKVAPPAAV